MPRKQPQTLAAHDLVVMGAEWRTEPRIGWYWKNRFWGSVSSKTLQKIHPIYYGQKEMPSYPLEEGSSTNAS